MAEYKQPCIHCDTYIDRDARFCPKCGSNTPFGYLCPTCLKPISKDDMLCSGCGRNLRITCPVCDGDTFVGEKCDVCGVSLLIKCPNERCGQKQFYQNEKCTACGKKIKEKYRVLVAPLSNKEIKGG